MENTQETQSAISSTIKKQSVFIEYTCIRNLPYLILKYLKETDYIRDALKDYINFEPIVNMSDEGLHTVSIQRKHKNIFKTIPKLKDFDTENSLKDILRTSLYDIVHVDTSDYGYHSICFMVFNLLPMEFCQDIYIHYEEPIMEIVEDLIETYGENSRLHFIYGDFKQEIYNRGDCDLFILDDSEHLQFMKDHGMLEGKEFLLSNYYFNIDKYVEELVPKVTIDEEKDKCKFGIYSPINVNILKRNN